MEATLFGLVILVLILIGWAVTDFCLHRLRIRNKRATLGESASLKIEQLLSQGRAYKYAWIGTNCGCAALSLFIFVGLCTFNQGAGQASVLVSVTGRVLGTEQSEGLHLKAPWSYAEIYDIKNNTVSFVGTDGNKDDYVGGDAALPQVTFQDADNVTGNVDLNVRYTIRSNAVEEIYRGYKTQQQFISSVVAPSIRSTTREVLSQYSTTVIYTQRETITETLTSALSDDWEEYGVDVEAVFMQEIRYPDTITTAFAEAQAAKTRVEKAKAEQEQAQVEAQTNSLKSSSLTQPVLMEKLIDAIKNGNGTYVVDTSNLSISVK